MPDVPQPSVSRLTPFAGRPAVVGIVPGQPDLVVATAVAWAQAVGSPGLVAAYVDPTRYVVEELPDGSVRHAAVDPDSADDSWQQRLESIETFLHQHVDPTGVAWQVRYLAGRPDRALTHLARVVDAAVIVVGTRAPGLRENVRAFLEGSVAVRLTHHQHRPVLVVPLSVVDWKAPLAWS